MTAMHAGEPGLPPAGGLRPPDGAPPVSRRALLTGAAVATAAAGVLAEAAVPPGASARAELPVGAASATVPFRGPRQSAVSAPQQPYTLLFGADQADPGLPVGEARSRLAALLADWTDLLDRAASGTAPELRSRDATRSRLTAAVGVGPALASRLRLRVPEALRDLPAHPGDRLDPARSGGDVLVQLCADDRWPLTAAADLLQARARGLLTVRWRQTGFLPREPDGVTPRNLLGFKDGTANPDPADQDQWIWLPPGPHEHGTILVYRRIHLATGAFAALPLPAQEAAIGRRRADGAPLGGSAEHDPVELWAKHPDGSYVVPAAAHVRLASPRFDAGARMLRRGYSYDDGLDDQGLLFCACMRDPALFTRVQSRLDSTDALGPYVEHRASAVCYILPGALPGRPLGASLLA
jgi:dye decolorizing peroxidase